MSGIPLSKAQLESAYDAMLSCVSETIGIQTIQTYYLDLTCQEEHYYLSLERSTLGEYLVDVLMYSTLSGGHLGATVHRGNTYGWLTTS